MYSGEPASKHHDASASVTVACRITLEGGLRVLQRPIYSRRNYEGSEYAGPSDCAAHWVCAVSVVQVWKNMERETNAVEKKTSRSFPSFSRKQSGKRAIIQKYGKEAIHNGP